MKNPRKNNFSHPPFGGHHLIKRLSIRKRTKKHASEMDRHHRVNAGLKNEKIMWKIRFFPADNRKPIYHLSTNRERVGKADVYIRVLLLLNVTLKITEFTFFRSSNTICSSQLNNSRWESPLLSGHVQSAPVPEASACNQRQALLIRFFIEFTYWTAPSRKSQKLQNQLSGRKRTAAKVQNSARSDDHFLRWIPIAFLII